MYRVLKSAKLARIERFDDVIIIKDRSATFSLAGGAGTVPASGGWDLAFLQKNKAQGGGGARVRGTGNLLAGAPCSGRVDLRMCCVCSTNTLLCQHPLRPCSPAGH